MKELLGTVFSGLITDENEQHYYVQKNGQTFQLNKSEGTHELGKRWKGLVILTNNKNLP